MKNNDKINKYTNKNSSIYINKGNKKMKSLGLISSYDDNNNSDDIESVRIKPMGMNRSMEYNVIVAQ